MIFEKKFQIFLGKNIYIPNLSFLLSLESLEKVPGGGGGGWWVVLEYHFSVLVWAKPKALVLA